LFIKFLYSQNTIRGSAYLPLINRKEKLGAKNE